MTTTALDQLRHFHITGLGLEDAMPAPALATIADGRTIPAEESSYPIGIAADSSVQPHAKAYQAPFHTDAALTLTMAALLHARRPLREAFLLRLRQTAERLDDLLALDETHGEEAHTPAAIALSLGGGGSAYFNTAALTGALRKRKSPVERMSAARRERCMDALQAVRQAIAVAAAQPAAAVFYRGSNPPNPFLAELHPTSDPCASGLAYVRALLASAEATLRALRVAHLELESAYDATRHEAILDRFHWESVDPAEIGALPPVVAFLTPDQLLRCPLRSLSALLRSGCPLQAVVAQSMLTTDDLRADSPDLAALAVSHGEAFLLPGSLAAPEHLLASLAAMSRTFGRSWRFSLFRKLGRSIRSTSGAAAIGASASPSTPSPPAAGRRRTPLC